MTNKMKIKISKKEYHALRSLAISLVISEGTKEADDHDPLLWKKIITLARVIDRGLTNGK